MSVNDVAPIVCVRVCTLTKCTFWGTFITTLLLVRVLAYCNVLLACGCCIVVSCIPCRTVIIICI